MCVRVWCSFVSLFAPRFTHHTPQHAPHTPHTLGRQSGPPLHQDVPGRRQGGRLWRWGQLIRGKLRPCGEADDDTALRTWCGGARATWYTILIYHTIPIPKPIPIAIPIPIPISYDTLTRTTPFHLEASLLLFLLLLELSLSSLSHPSPPLFPLLLKGWETRE